MSWTGVVQVAKMYAHFNGHISSHRIVADEDTQAGERAGVVEKLQPLLHGRVGRQGFGGKVRLFVSEVTGWQTESETDRYPAQCSQQ